MNKDTVKGTVDDAAGRAKRQVGEWTGNTDTQVEGAGQQIKVKDAAHDASKDASKSATTNTEHDNEVRERQRHEEERKHHEVIGS